MNFKFDGNEWYVVISSIIVMSGFYMIRKHFRPLMIVILWVFIVTLIATIDYLLAATPFYLYVCLDNETYEPMGAYAHLFLYSPFAFLFLYFYDKWSIRGIKLISYLAAWTCISIFYEWLSLKFGFLDYSEGWKLHWSIPTYPICAVILIWVYRFLKIHLDRHPLQTSEYLERNKH